MKRKNLAIILASAVLLIGCGKNEKVTPDAPQAFGYNTSWMAIKSDDPKECIEMLNLKKPKPANWESGIAAVQEYTHVFVSPSMDGYVLVIGIDDLDEAKAGLAKTAAKVPELLYFGTHSTVDYHWWAKYEDGDLTRAYAYLGESGEVVWDEGALTEEELALGGDKFPKAGEALDWDNMEFPDEEIVDQMAAAWSVDPEFAAKEYEPSSGYLCEK